MPLRRPSIFLKHPDGTGYDIYEFSSEEERDLRWSEWTKESPRSILLKAHFGDERWCIVSVGFPDNIVYLTFSATILSCTKMSIDAVMSDNNN